MAMAASAGITVAQAYGQAEAMKAQGEYQNTMSQINARNAELQADRAVKQGDKNAAAHMGKVNQTIGQQKVAYGAKGVDINYGSAKQVVQETREIGYDDAITIKNNAFLEGMGYKQQAFNSAQAGRIAQSTGESNANATLLSGGIKAAGSIYNNGGLK